MILNRNRSKRLMWGCGLLLTLFTSTHAAAESIAAALKAPIPYSGNATLSLGFGYVRGLGLDGRAIGYTNGLSGAALPTIWKANGTGITFDNFRSGIAFGINDAREVAVLSDHNLYRMSALSYTNGGREQWRAELVKADAILTPDVGVSGGLNAHGQILSASAFGEAGALFEADGSQTAVGSQNLSLNNGGSFLGSNYVGHVANGTFQQTPLVIPETYTSVRARSLNDAGAIVGSALVGASSAANTRPFRYDASGFSPLPLPGTATAGAAMSLNESGVAVGWFLNDVSRFDAVVWQDGVPVALRSLVPSAVVAGARDFFAEMITDTGYVLGATRYATPPGGSTPQDKYWVILVPQLGTYGRGDANFDTKIDFTDLVILAQKYGLANTAQATNVADFDLNGVTDFQDLVALSQNYGTGTAGNANFAADWALAQSLVPEPSTLASIAMLLSFGGRRRRCPPQG